MGGCSGPDRFTPPDRPAGAQRKRVMTSTKVDFCTEGVWWKPPRSISWQNEPGGIHRGRFVSGTRLVESTEVGFCTERGWWKPPRSVSARNEAGGVHQGRFLDRTRLVETTEVGFYTIQTRGKFSGLIPAKARPVQLTDSGIPGRMHGIWRYKNSRAALTPCPPPSSGGALGDACFWVEAETWRCRARSMRTD